MTEGDTAWQRMRPCKQYLAQHGFCQNEAIQHPMKASRTSNWYQTRQMAVPRQGRLGKAGARQGRSGKAGTRQGRSVPLLHVSPTHVPSHLIAGQTDDDC